MTATATAPTRTKGGARLLVGGLLLLLAALYFAGEAWAAAGWEGRAYRWDLDAISSLGVPETMRSSFGVADATHHAVMNATFVGTGVRALLAGAVLAPFVPRRGRGTVLGLVLGYGTGLLLVGLFPTGGSPVRETMHAIGAVLVIIGGSVLLVALALSLRRRPALAVVTGVLAAVSVTGSVCILAGIGGFGLVERVAVYPLVLWQVLVGAAILLTRPRT